MALFSASEQTHCTLNICNSKWVTAACFWISTEVVYLQHCLVVTWCHVKLLPSQCMFCVHHTTMLWIVWCMHVSCIDSDVHSCFKLWSAMSQSSWIRLSWIMDKCYILLLLCANLQFHFIWSCLWWVHLCLAVTIHLHLWQDTSHATAVTWGWNGYWNDRQHRKLTLEKNTLLPFLLGLKPMTFQSWVHRATTELSPLPSFQVPKAWSYQCEIEIDSTFKLVLPMWYWKK